MKLSNFQKSLLKKTVILLSVFSLAFTLVLYFFLDPFLQKRLIFAVSEASDGLYVLEIKDLHCNPLTGYAHIEQIWLHTDTMLLDKRRLEHPEISVSNIDLHVPHLEINNARFAHSFASKNIDLGRIEVKEPNIRLIGFRDSTISNEYEADSLEKSLLERLPALLSTQAHSIRISLFSLTNATLYLETRSESKRSLQEADSINCTLDQVFIPEVAQDTADRALYAADARGDFKNYRFKTSTSPYAFAIGAGTFASEKATVKLTSISAGPVIDDETFVRHQKYRRGRIRLNINALEINRLDFFQALHLGRWKMEHLGIKNGHLDVYVDKRLEHVPDKRMPNEIMRLLDFYLRVDSVSLKNIDILFHEKKPDGATGEISFLNTSAKVFNLTNDVHLMTDSTPALLYASTQLMGRGNLSLSLRYALLSRDFACSYQATLDTMPLVFFNPLFEKDKIQFEDGYLESVKLQARVSNGKASGTLNASYRNLKIEVKTADGNKTRAFLTSLVNALIRNKNKPREEPLTAKTGTIDYQRIPGDDFWRFLWRSARSGLVEIILPKGFPAPLPDDHPKS